MNQCRANAKATGVQCKRGAIPGGTVCKKHGGGAPQVIAKAQERLADLIDPDRTLREAARLAFSDVGDLFDENNCLLPLKSWPAHIRAAVSSVKNRKFNAESGDGKQDDIVELKLWDKPKNIEMLMKHLKLLGEGNTVNINILALDGRIREARKRGLSLGDGS